MESPCVQTLSPRFRSCRVVQRFATEDSVVLPLPSFSGQPHTGTFSSSVHAVERIGKLYSAHERGRDVQGKNKFALLAALAFAFICAHVSGQASKASYPGIQNSLVGSTLACSQTSTAPTIRVPLPLVDRAKLKARLATLLRDSLFDDAKGVVNIAREKEIKKLANKLARQKVSD